VIPGAKAVEKAIWGEQVQNESTTHDIKDDGIPPTRPQNDTQVEEFLRKQYKSQSGADMAEVDSAKQKMGNAPQVAKTGNQ
jgi:hypothetical protein